MMISTINCSCDKLFFIPLDGQTDQGDDGGGQERSAKDPLYGQVVQKTPDEWTWCRKKSDLRFLLT